MQPILDNPARAPHLITVPSPSSADQRRDVGNLEDRGSELRRHWPIVLAAIVGIMLGAWALPLFLLGPLTGSLRTEFGWSVATVAAGATFLAAGTTLGTPLIGMLADRLPPRRLAVGSIAVFALCLAGIASVDGTAWHLHAMWFALNFLGVGSGGIIYTRVIGATFQSQRGLALGIALSGTGVAAFVTPLIAQALIPLIGWRGTILAFVGLIACVALPIVAWGLSGATTDAGADHRPAPAHGVTRAVALRDARFYALLGSVTIFGLCVAGLVVHVIPMLTASGMSAAAAASIASLLGIAIVAGRLWIGWLLDRFAPALLGGIIFLLAALGAVLFVLAGPGAAAVTVLAIGLLLGAEVDLMSFLTIRYFGNRHYGAIYGLLFAGYAACGIASPLIASAIVTRGGYDMLFSAAAGAFATAAALMVWLSRNDRICDPIVMDEGGR